jgi:hypothetical protein
MQARIKIVALAVALMGTACAAQAQTAAPAPQPATIESAAWLAGRWVGEGFGGQMEETWAPPIGGQMIGHFRHWREGTPQFYELLLLDVTDQGVRMRVKHFNPDFVAWEERDGWHTFEPVSAGPDALLFAGFEIRRDGPNRIEMRIGMERNGVASWDTLRFERAPL